MKPYHLCAGIRINDAQQLGIARKALFELQQETRKEPKCLLFSVFEDPQQPGQFWLWESWRGKQGLEEHFQTPHTKHYLALKLTDVVEVIELTELEDDCNDHQI